MCWSHGGDYAVVLFSSHHICMLSRTGLPLAFLKDNSESELHFWPVAVPDPTLFLRCSKVLF